MAAMKWDYWTEGEDGFDYCQSIYELSRHFKPKYGLEIGVRFGKSALATMLGSPKMKLIGVDPNPEFPVEEFLKEKVGGRFIFINNASPQALEQFPDDMFDWIYIDGRHDYMGVKDDFYASWRLLNKGGVMVFDDYNPNLGYGTEVDKVLNDHTEAVTGKPFKYLTMTDFGCHPSPHDDAVIIK